MKPGTIVTGKLTSALKQLGFDYVFDTDWSADLTIMEEGTELIARLYQVFKRR
jgi:NADP-reducing hydrogenase subunit HndD